MRLIILTLTYLYSLHDAAHGQGVNSLASVFQDHMVLQGAPQMAGVWGSCCKGCTTYVTLINVHQNSQVGNYSADCREDVPGVRYSWLISMDRIADSDPYEIRVLFQSPGESVRLYQIITDVHFGDVWLCSGQSNMVFPVENAMMASEILAEAGNYPQIRMLTISQTTSNDPLFDAKIKTPWSISNHETVAPFSAVCWLYARALVDDYQKLKYFGLVESDWGGTPIESWSSPKALSQCTSRKAQRFTSNSRQAAPDPHENSVLWNGMIHPLLNMTIKGALWYQGEANAAKPDTYNCTFPAMIRDWRYNFYQGSEGQNNMTFPFGFVQLAPNRNEDIVRGFPDIRWHQTGDMGTVPNAILPGVFMAVAMDLPDFSSPHGSIHPRYKTLVADRLAFAGRAVVYGEKINIQGPMISAYYADIRRTDPPSTLKLEFDRSQTKIDVRSNSGYEICCSTTNTSYCDFAEDPRWQKVPITASDDHSVTLSMTTECEGKWWAGIRYAWRESPCALKQCAVYNWDNGLPAPPYIALGLIN